MNSHHKELLDRIRKKSGKPTQPTFSDQYLGNSHPRYSISMPVLRLIAKEWIKENRDVSSLQFISLLSSLIKAKSSTEKCFAGILLGYAAKEQRGINPKYFDEWLEYLVGWAEVDCLCTGKHFAIDIPLRWNAWRKIITKFSKNKNINKRRASIVLLCSPLSQVKDVNLAEAAFKNIDRLKNEKEILITKAISWVLRSMVKLYPRLVEEYLKDNLETLPKIAIRETRMKLKTGKKTKSL